MAAIQDSEFQAQVLENPKLTLVDFWAEWCGPCRILGPVIDEIAVQLGDRAQVFKMDVDQNPVTPAQYSIRGIPTVLLFKGGKLVDQIVGARPKDAILEVISKHLD